LARQRWQRDSLLTSHGAVRRNANALVGLPLNKRFLTAFINSSGLNNVDTCTRLMTSKLAKRGLRQRRLARCLLAVI